MRTKLLLLAIAAVLLTTSCKKDKETIDPYETFKADATPRWENGSAVEQNDKSAYTFIVDKGGNLFSSDKYKIGRTSADGSSYEFIEFSGVPVAGKPSGASIRTEQGVTTPTRLEIVKTENGKSWIVFKETETATERRVVQ